MAGDYKKRQKTAGAKSKPPTPVDVVSRIVEQMQAQQTAANASPALNEFGLRPLTDAEEFTRQSYRNPSAPVSPTKFATAPLAPIPLADSMGPMPGSTGSGAAQPAVAPQTQSLLSRITGPMGTAMQQLAAVVSKQFASDGNDAKSTSGKPKKAEKKAGSSKKTPGRRTSRGKKKGGGLGKGLGDIIGKVTAAIMPLAIIGNMLNAQTSGFSVFLTSMKLIGSTMGMVLAPLFIGLSAVMYALSEAIAEELIPNLESFYKGTLNGMVQAVDVATDFLSKFGLAVDHTLDEIVIAGMQFVAWVQRNTGHGDDAKQTEAGVEKMKKKIAEDEQTRKTDEALKQQRANMSPEEKEVADMIQRQITGKLVDLQTGTKDDFGGGDFGGDSGKGSGKSFKADFLSGLKMSVEEFRRSAMPQAQQSTLVGASRNAQMSALNATPFETKMLDRVQTVIGVLERVANNQGMGY